MTQTVFPPEDVRNISKFGKNDGFTIPPGRYYYPFTFRIPINNDCLQSSSFLNKVALSHGVDISRDPSHHIRTTLPPSLSGLSEASIRYYFLRLLKICLVIISVELS